MCGFVVKQKTAYEMRISDWSSDVCSSDLPADARAAPGRTRHLSGADRGAYGQAKPDRARPDVRERLQGDAGDRAHDLAAPRFLRTRLWRASLGDVAGERLCPPVGRQRHRRLERAAPARRRSEEHTSELQSLMRTSY